MKVTIEVEDTERGVSISANVEQNGVSNTRNESLAFLVASRMIRDLTELRKQHLLEVTNGRNPTATH